MAVSNSPQMNLWDIANSKLSIKDEEVLKSGLVLPIQLDDLRDPIEKARDSTSRWKPKTRKYLNNMVLWVQKFIIVGDTVVTYDPGHAALPWAALRFVLQVVVSDFTKKAEFTESLERVAFYVYDSAVRELLYLEWTVQGKSIAGE